LCNLFAMRENSDFQEHLQGWFAGRLPGDWFEGAPSVEFDNDEILVVGDLTLPDLPGDAGPETRKAATQARIQGFREDTRGLRMRIADEAERRFGRKVSWGARCGEREVTFTTVATPAMTRLRMSERKVLDTLVEAGVARSRSHALRWCVRLVADKQDEWLADLRKALEGVEAIRREGPRT
jgi:hypothetical protein